MNRYLSMMILLTGASGHVGSHVVPELRRRGHPVRALLRSSKKPAGVDVVRGDVTDPEAVARAVEGVDTVIHLAAVIPPAADDHPQRARAVNVGGTANIVAACLARPDPPRLLFTSTLAVHGHTLDRPPPRRVDDPLVATDPYSEHKIESERLIRESGLAWSILRLVDIPTVRDPHPIMFEIGLDNRTETVHADDAALAIVNALETPEVWGRVLFIGGGESCQLTYREYLTRMLTAVGTGPLPEEAFSDKVYCTDWVDTTESEALLRYQRHTFDEIAESIAASLGWKRRLMPLARPLARAAMLKLSPYYRRN